MPRFRRFAFALFACFALSGASPAGGGEKPNSSLKSPTWKVMTDSDATSSSHCIGSSKTAVCAVETFIACQVRHDDRLCDGVLAPGLSDSPDHRALEPGDKVEYRIFAMRRDMAVWGTAFVVSTRERSCPAAEADCSRTYADYYDYWVHQTAPNRWIVIYQVFATSG